MIDVEKLRRQLEGCRRLAVDPAAPLGEREAALRAVVKLEAKLAAAGVSAGAGATREAPPQARYEPPEVIGTCDRCGNPILSDQAFQRRGFQRVHSYNCKADAFASEARPFTDWSWAFGNDDDTPGNEG